MDPNEVWARKIPAVYRREILLTNMVNTAVALPGDEAMKHLVVYFKDYLEPNLDITCNSCYGRVLNVFKVIQPYLIQLEKEAELLNEV